MRDDTKVNRGRGRPRAYDRDAALAAIAETFKHRGYAGTSLDDIASATGMNRPSLYAAFGNKKALYLTALDKSHADMVELFSRSTDGGGPIRERLTRFFDSAIAHYCAGPYPGCLVLCTATAEAAADEEVRRKLADVSVDIERHIRQLLALDATTQAEDRRADASILTSALISIAVRARMRTSPRQLRDLAQATLAAVLDTDAVDQFGSARQ